MDPSEPQDLFASALRLVVAQDPDDGTWRVVVEIDGVPKLSRAVYESRADAEVGCAALAVEIAETLREEGCEVLTREVEVPDDE